MDGVRFSTTDSILLGSVLFFMQIYIYPISSIPFRKTLSVVLFSGMIFFAPQQVSAITPDTLTVQAADYSETIDASALTALLHLETHLTYFPSYTSEIEDTSFCPTEDFFCQFSLSRAFSHHLKTETTYTPDTEALKRFIAHLREKVNQDPVDVRFTVSDGQVIVAESERTGRHLNEEKSLILLRNALQNTTKKSVTVTLETTITEPKLVATDRERLGLKELVGEGTTNFSGSTKNRIYNIKRALEQFQNIVIAPNEEFSFIKYLGEVDGEHGYLPELVIKNNQTTPEFGGGICQVSSTVFRTAIYSGMKITARRNHAYPVHYYAPYGMDATVYIPKPDLTFVNNTPGAILVQSSIEGTKLTFRFYGTNDKRNVVVDGPHILEHNPDGSMKTVFTQEVNTAEGENFIRDSFWSNYKSPSLYPLPGQEQVLVTKPNGWSEREWTAYKKIHP
ncbi:MAG: VanW family protein [Candidatus Moranbacteria bacterium]|nr:VanW family protein [Candidatus Moranbacteria bacterium]